MGAEGACRGGLQMNYPGVQGGKEEAGMREVEV